MGYETPKFSKNKVNRAGDILSERRRKKTSENIDAINILSNWRGAHAYPTDKFHSTLKRKLKGIDPDAFSAQRLKRTPSIIEKLKRFKTMNLSQMQVIGGLRAVLSSIYKVRKIEDEYRSPRFNHELVDWDDYISEPKSDGYRGLHLIFKYRSTEAGKYNNLLVELQLRTKTQHAWATAVETMDVYLGQALKLGKGSRKWKRFFKYTSMAFSVLEGAPPVPGFSNISERKIFQEVRKMDGELNVLEKLKGFSIATDMILNEPGVGAYNIIMLNVDEKNVRIIPYPKTRLSEANDALTKLERLYSDNKGIDLVLVSAGPLKKLKKSYPNYFLDTVDFIRKVNKVIALSKTSQRTIDEASPKKKIKRKSSLHGDVKNLLFSRDIPQADSLDSVRKIVEAINDGIATIKGISNKTGYKPRHVQYKLVSAQILGFLEKSESIYLTPKGKLLLQKKMGSNEESVFLRQCIEQTKFFNLIAQDLFTDKRPYKHILAKRIMDYANLSESTALRRASTLIAWSNQILQGSLKIN